MRFLLVIYPAQGHINPGLQFAKRLVRMGVEVTFVTNLSAHRRMTKTSTPTGLSFAPFSDGYDDGFKPGDDIDHFLSEISRCGSQALSDLVVTAANEGRPFSFIVYSILLPWAAETANQLHVPSALLWIQPATVFDIYYYYFHDYSDIIDNTNSDSADGISCSIELPGLPLKLTKRDLPSFMDAGNTYTFAIPLFKAQFEILDKESNPKVLLNTFDALEPEALSATGGKFNLIGVGPLIPSAFLDGKDPSDTSFGGDLVQHPKGYYYMEWLKTKPKRSVIYVSFGSMSVLSKPQMEELGRALLSIGRPFLWVIRDKEKDQEEEEEEEDKLVSCREELEKLGMLVPWCSQVEVLSNPSLGCF